VVDTGEEEYEEYAECPNCGAIIPLDAKVCPNCGVEFAEEFEVIEEEVGEEAAEIPEEGAEVEEEVGEEGVPEEYEGVIEEGAEAEEAAIEEILAEEVVEEKPTKFFWIGIILMVGGFFGGPILSYLHDALKIPIGRFKAYYSFGWVNWTVAIAGLVVFLVGVGLVIVGLKRIKDWQTRMGAPVEVGEEGVEEIGEELAEEAPEETEEIGEYAGLAGEEELEETEVEYGAEESIGELFGAEETEYGEGVEEAREEGEEMAEYEEGTEGYMEGFEEKKEE